MMESSLDLTELEKLRSEAKENEEEKKENVQSQRRKILLEPALICAMIAINLGQTSLQNFYLRTACKIDLKYPLETCEAVHGGPLEADSQRVVSGVNISRSFVGSLIATVVLLFVGPWSDCSGRRKPLLILPLVGMSIMTTGVLLMLIFPGASTVQVLYIVQIPMSLGGNFGLLLAAAFSHIGDVCHSTGRDVTRTMGSHRAAIQVAHVVGSVSGPLLFRTFGYYGVFPIVLLLQVTSLLYIMLYMHDTNVNKENKVNVYDWRLPFRAIACLVKSRERQKRTIILLMLVVGLGDRIMLSAEVLLSYMYYRYKFNWNDILFGSFLAYRNIISFIGTLFILAILKRKLKLSDEFVGMLSCVSLISATSGLIITTTTVFVFLLPLIGIISQGSQVVQRPLLNKQIAPNEQGKIYSVLGALESATQTFTSPLYSLLYKKTVANTPDAWLIPGIVLAFVQALCYYITKRLGGSNHPKSQTPEKQLKSRSIVNMQDEKVVEVAAMLKEKHQEAENILEPGFKTDEAKENKEILADGLQNIPVDATFERVDEKVEFKKARDSKQDTEENSQINKPD